MPTRDPEREARAALRRQTWAFHLGESPAGPAAATPAERLAAVWELTCDAWALSGRPMPEYARAEMPGKVTRLEAA